MIYLDNAATTAMYPECLDIYKKYAVEQYFNPSALYTPALTAANAVKDARAKIANVLGCKADELVFTASGSEADNFAITRGIRAKKGKIIISEVEHAAVYNCAKSMESKGYTVVTAPCDRFGRVDEEKFVSLLDDEVVFVSVMHVCNETGALNDIRKLVSLTKQRCPQAVFHSDGVQAFGKVDFSVKDLGVDLYSISGHKIHAPKGIGALYIKNGLNLNAFIFGGGQEKNLRSGTENVAGICAFAYCAERAKSQLKDYYNHCKNLQKQLIDGINSKFGSLCRVNTDTDNSGCNIVNFAFDGIRGEVMLHYLEQYGIIVGTGSACSSKKAASRIPKALGLNGALAEGTLRISFNKENTEQDVDFLLDKLQEGAELLGKYKRV